MESIIFILSEGLLGIQNACTVLSELSASYGLNLTLGSTVFAFLMSTAVVAVIADMLPEGNKRKAGLAVIYAATLLGSIGSMSIQRQSPPLAMFDNSNWIESSVRLASKD